MTFVEVGRSDVLIPAPIFKMTVYLQYLVNVMDVRTLSAQASAICMGCTAFVLLVPACTCKA